MKGSAALALILWLVAHHASAQDAYCQDAYTTIKAAYDAGHLGSCLDDLNALSARCANDPITMEQVLLLKAVTEYRLDSMDAMHRTLERVQRNNRHLIELPKDPLFSDHHTVGSAYIENVGSRFRMDHGQYRAGLYTRGQSAILDVSPERAVFANDDPLDYKGLLGWEVGVVAEVDLVPNLAARLTLGYSEWRYEATSATQQYTEKLRIAPVSVGLKKMFWLGGSPWLPIFAGQFTYGRLFSSTAQVERFGDGLRFAPRKTVDRTLERRRDQLWVGGSVGAARKWHGMVGSVEIGYQHALANTTLDSQRYTETELLTNYYWKDSPISISGVTLILGVQYVLSYHKQNRFYP